MIPALLGGLAVWMALPPRPDGGRGLPTGLTRAGPSLAGAGVLAWAAAAGHLGRGTHVLLLAIGCGVTWGLHRLWRERARSQRLVATRSQVLQTCELLAAELRAGQPPGAALVRAAGDWAEMAPVAKAHEWGGDVPAALRRAALAPGADGLRVVAAAWQVAHRTGDGLADALVRVAEALRSAAATDRVVRGELASARATARLVAVLPLVALAMGAGSGGRPLSFLLGTPVGAACLGCGVALGLVGLAWIERLSAGVMR